MRVKMNPGADRLPGEVLVVIFSYLPCEDLVKSVQFVCTWWQQVSREKSLWKHIMYKPGSSRENVTEILEISPQLRILNLSFETVDYYLIRFIADSCPNLEELHMSWDSIYSMSDVTIIHPLRQIKILNLFWYANTNLNFTLLDIAFPNLESLYVAQLRFDIEDLETYLQKKQSTLHTLSIRCSTAGDHCVLPCLSVCTKLRNLSLYEVCNKVSWEDGYLPNISHLTLMNFRMNNVNDNSGVFCAFPNITALVLHYCTVESENVLALIARNCHQLQKLKVSHYNAWFISKQIMQNAFHLVRVTHLNIYYNTCLTDKDTEHFLLMPQLVYLDLYDCQLLTTGCLKLICGFSKLEVLKFDLKCKPADLRASDVKNKNLQLIFYNCPDVSSLDSLRQEHLRVCMTGSLRNGIKNFYGCSKIRYERLCCTCWSECCECSVPTFSHC